MNLVKSFSDRAQSFNNDRKESQMSYIPKFVVGDESGCFLNLEDFPDSVRECIETIAATVFGQSTRRLVVIGEQSTGKSFLVEQVARNSRLFSERNRRFEEMVFLRMNSINLMELGNSITLNAMLDALCKTLDCSRESLCIVTEDLDVAMFVAKVATECAIVLEARTEDFLQYIQMDATSITKDLTSWSIVQSDEFLVTKKELTLLLSETVGRELNLDENTILSFIEMMIEEIPSLTRMDDYLECSPGVWNTAFRQYFSLVSSSSGDLKKSSRRAITQVKATFEQSLSEPHSCEKCDEDKDLLEAIFGDKLKTRLSSKSDEPVEPVVFGDMVSLKDRLSGRIFGQSTAVETVAEAMMVPAAGLNDPERPLRSFLFVGPTGVGKTQLARELASELTVEPMHVIRIDMSEYQHSHEVAKLFGSPPGYVGSERGGILTRQVSENPKSVVIFDEMEKADSSIWDALLQVLDTGTMTDSRGDSVSFRQCVIIFTSNIGAAESNRSKAGFSLGPGRTVDEGRIITKTAVERTLSPEFINRLDEIVYFEPIDKTTARSIIDRELNVLNDRLKTVVIEKPSSEVIDFLLSKADISKYGAREIQRTIARHVTSPIALHLSSNNDCSRVGLRKDFDKIKISSLKEAL